jgi:hypothetical protein
LGSTAGRAADRAVGAETVTRYGGCRSPARL